MTAIIAHRSGWMASDSLATDHDRIFKGPVKKLLKLGDHTLLGIAGVAGFETAAREALVDAAEDRDRVVEVLSSWIRDHFHDEFGYTVLLVNTKQELVEVDSLGAILPIEGPCWSIGSGGEVCQAYLEGLLSNYPSSSFQLQPHHGERAIAYCSTALTSVGGPCQTLNLYG